MNWDNSCELVTSWKRCARDISSNFVLSMTLTATFSPVKTWRANFTTAKWPRPESFNQFKKKIYSKIEKKKIEKKLLKFCIQS